jgi:uncharacterized membrane protein
MVFLLIPVAHHLRMRTPVTVERLLLGIFAVTALKLVLVDMAGIKQIYRTLSFLVLGLLMIGVSYLHHKVEKHLAASEAQEP